MPRSPVGVRDHASPSPSCTGGRRPSGTSSSRAGRCSPSIASRSFGTTCQVDRHGGDPVLDDVRLPRACRRRCAGAQRGDREGQRARTPAALAAQTLARHGVTTIVPPMSGPWIQQKYLYVPGFVNVTFDDCGSGTARPGRHRRREEAVAVVRAVVACTALRLRAVREERRDLVRRCRALSATGRSSSEALRCTSSARTRRCAAPRRLVDEVTVVPDLHRQRAREVAEDRRRRPDAHVDRLRRRLRRSGLRLRLRPAG